ncbi:MAG: hypothetical protein ABEI77_01870 [Halorientalis sp.]
MNQDRTTDDDHITDAILSGSAYERLRVQRPTYFTQPIPSKLTAQSVLLAGLALLLPLYLLFPATVAEYLPATDPALASPKDLLLGLVGAGVELFAAVLLVGTALVRIRWYPLSESRARTVLNVEDFASYLGFGTGGMAIAITMAYFVLGLAGGRAIAGYVTAMDGINPFVDSGLGLSVVELAGLSFVGCLCLLVVGQYLRRRLGTLRR